MGNKTRKTVQAVVFLCTVLLVLGISCIDVQAEVTENISVELLDDNSCIKMGNGAVIAQARFGYKGKCKYGRNLRADVVIEARKNSYSGSLRVEYMVPWPGNSVMVQKSVNIPEGGESKIHLALPALPFVEDMEIKVSLRDADGEELCSKYFIIFPFGDNISPVFTGILSDSQDKMEYIIKQVSP